MALYAGLILATGCAERLGVAAIVRPIRLPVMGSPSQRFSDFTLHSGEVTLRGWLFQPEHAPKGLVVYLHGKDANRWGGDRAARHLVKEGFAVLAYDQRAHGASSGEFCTYGHYEVEDLKRALDQVGITPVYVVGESMGAAVALQAATSEKRIRGVVAAASFSDLETIVRERAPFFFDEWQIKGAIQTAEREAGFCFNEISPERSAEALQVPVLLIHGDEDGFTGLEHSRRILKRLRHDKRLVIAVGVGHGDVLAHDALWEIITAWISGVAASPRSAAGRQSIGVPSPSSACRDCRDRPRADAD
jgi:pimeloyl-ACP methyl ester carboxylesterase